MCLTGLPDDPGPFALSQVTIDYEVMLCMCFDKRGYSPLSLIMYHTTLLDHLISGTDRAVVDDV